MKVIKLAYLIASFPLTLPPSGTETSAKGCLVIAGDTLRSIYKGVEADDGPLSTDKRSQRSQNEHISLAFVFIMQALHSVIIVIKP